ncbi:MAG: ribosomal protein S19 family protein, partial [Candidatus Methanofastidiosia archaeon]
MARKIFTYRGYKIEELKKMSMDKFIELLPARQRKTLRKGLAPRQRKLLEKLRKSKEELSRGIERIVRTHSRDMVVLPEMVGLKVGIYNGKEYKIVGLKP